MHNENQKLISTAKVILNSDIAKEFDKIFDIDSRIIDTEILAKLNNYNQNTDKKGNHTAKTYYKTKKGVSRRVMDIKSLLSTSKTYSDTTFSGAKIPHIFDITLNFEENFTENSQSGKDVKFSISPEVDAEYMAAVESGDMEKAGAMVKAAFKARFPWVSAPVSLTIS